MLRVLLLVVTVSSLQASSSRTRNTCAVGEGSEEPLAAFGSLAWLTYPLSESEFLSDYFEKEPIHFSRDNASYHMPLRQAWSDVNAAVGFKTRHGGYMLVRATKRGVDVEPFHYWSSPEVLEASSKSQIKRGRRTSDRRAHWDPDALNHLFKEGFTLNYPAIESHSLDLLRKRAGKKNIGKNDASSSMLLRDFSKTLSVSMGVYTRLNMYVTPYGNAGFKSHFDSHDVYVLQIQGTKRWRVYPTPLVMYPVSDWGESQLSRSRSSLGPPLLDIMLRPGDALFIPRGFVHEADCNELGDMSPKNVSASVHITLGIMNVKVADLFFIAGRIAINSNSLSRAYIKRLRNALQKRAKSQVAFRKAASPLCKGKKDEICMKSSKYLSDTFHRFVLKEFDKSEDENIRTALTSGHTNYLDDAFAWIRKKQRLGTRSPSKFSLSKLRPITHSMQEYRVPRRLDKD